jgi:hypothetical protein
MIIRYLQVWEWSMISLLWDSLLTGVAKILSKISSPPVGFSWKSDPFESASKRKRCLEIGRAENVESTLYLAGHDQDKCAWDHEI